MKILMKVEDVALMAVRPSQISLRLGALLDKNRRRRPLSRATKWLALLLTISFVPLLAAARAANDLSSPEKTVRSFVAALNAARFAEATRYVDGATPNSGLKEFRQNWKRDKVTFSVLKMTTATQGDKAIVKTMVAIAQTPSDPHQQVQTGNVALVRRNARWLIVPLNLSQAKKTPANLQISGMSVLTSMAGLVGSPEILDAQRDWARREACRSNLKQIALAAFQFGFDQVGANEKKLVMTPQNFKAKLLPYLKSEQIFRCPSVSSGESYSFNGNLTNYKLDNSPDAPRLVMFYEGKNGQLDFRHDGKTNVAFADGHVQTISREEAKTLRWKP